jgi:hypothetical protein
VTGYVYRLPPIDFFDREGWTPYGDQPDDLYGPDDIELAGDDAALDDAIATAVRVISTSPLYEPSLRSGPWYMRLPVEGYADAAYAVAIKIDNNGTVFVWSPFELPWLAKYGALMPADVAALDRARSRWPGRR